MRRTMQEIARDFFASNPTAEQHVLFLEALTWGFSEPMPVAKRVELLRPPSDMRSLFETAKDVNGSGGSLHKFTPKLVD